MSDLETQLRDAIKTLVKRGDAPPPPSTPSSEYGEPAFAPPPLATKPNTDRFEDAVRDELVRIGDYIVANESHALSPFRVFARVSTVEQMLVRIDDHINDLKTGKVSLCEPLVIEMISKLVLLQIAAKGMQARQ